MINKLHQYIKDLISGSSSYRGDCPSCSGKNTLSISKVDGNILYFCFRASCGLRGKLDAEISIDDLRTISNSMSTSIWNSTTDTAGLENAKEQQGGWTYPEYFCSPLQNKSSYNVLNRYHLIDFYTRCPDLIRYDPKLDRLVFILKDHKGVIKGATGRSLSFGVIPRWFVYSRYNGCPYILRRPSENWKDVVVIVEDCISASCIYPLSSSIGLLGTAISDELITYLIPFKRLYIALDDDATGKAIKLQKKLSIYKETHIIPLRKDLKYFTSQEIEQLVKEL